MAAFRMLGANKFAYRALSSEAGISLLEVLFGAAIVGIASVGAMVMFGMGQGVVQSGGDNRAALSIAQQRLEQVRAAGFGSQSLPDPREETAPQGVKIDNGNGVPIPNGLSDDDAIPGFRRRTIITGVCPTNFAIAYNNGGCPSSPNVEAKLVTVMVRMMDPSTGSETDVQTLPVVLTTVLVRK